MIERICPHCDAGNPSDQAYCGHCGTSLTQPLARRPAAALAQRPITIPTRWKETGKVVALGVATLAAEAGLAWLQRRQQPAARSPAPAPLARTQVQQAARVIAVGRRVTEIWSGGQLQQRTEEQVIWLPPDDRQP